MLVIRCPYCGERAESEFNFGGQAGIARPASPEHLSDEQWGEYLFMRDNTLGIHREQWVHTHGCRRWFVAERDTRSYQFKSTEKMGTARKERT